MKVYGDVVRKECPVCLSTDIENVWKIPMTTINKDEKLVISGARFHRVPFLNSETIYCFDMCNACFSIFLNPYLSGYWDDREVNYHVEKAKERREWAGYQARVKAIIPHIQSFGTVVDLACGGGQMLTILREDYRRKQWKRMVGIEINKTSVSYIKSIGFEGYVADVCKETPIKAGEADCVIFSEAMEHVQYPYLVIQEISRVLKVGGICYLTSQALEANLPVRPEEPIYMRREGVDVLLGTFDLRILEAKLDAGRWKVIAQKGKSCKG